MRISKTWLIFNALIWQKKKFWKKKKNPTSISVLGFLFFYLIFKKIVKSKWVVRQFKSEFQKLVKSWDSILRICNNFAIKRLSPHCAPALLVTPFTKHLYGCKALSHTLVRYGFVKSQLYNLQAPTFFLSLLFFCLLLY